jgi:zinc transport system substrate-binding protein
MLLPPASESHSFEPTPADIVKISNCDIFIYVGGESDSWVDTVLESMDGSNMRVVTLMDCVEVVEEELVEGMQEEEEESAESGEPEEPEYDEHVWTSPRNAKLIVAKITDALCEVAPQFAETFRANESEYSAKLDELDAGFREVVDGAARKTLVFGDRFPFRYFTDAYGLDYFAAFPGCSTETEPSAKTIAFLIDKVKAEQIPVVLHIELGAVRIAESIAEQTGAKVLELHSAHNISRDDFQAGRTYLDVMRTNIDRLKEALS